MLRLSLLLIVMLLCLSCTKLRLGYEYADWLVIYSIEDNFDLDKVQRTQIKLDVADYFKWHRKQMLPLYSDFLTQKSLQSKSGLSLAQVDTGFNQFQFLYQKTLEPFVDKAQRMLVSLTPSQVNVWLEKQKKKNQKILKEMSGGAQVQIERRYNKIVAELEDWTGDLTKEQKSQLKILNSALPWNGLLWLDNREKNQNQLAILLGQNASKATIKSFLNDFYIHPEKLRSPQFQKQNLEFESKLKIMIVAVYNLLSPEQRAHFILQAEKLSGEFHTLSLQE